ncbi:MAG: hypothetical protein JWR80_4876 [Bradyrhizobium sp.]|nr:hypothetical protein [Bradyrhizobium sp.]
MTDRAPIAVTPLYGSPPRFHRACRGERTISVARIHAATIEKGQAPRAERSRASAGPFPLPRRHVPIPSLSEPPSTRPSRANEQSGNQLSGASAIRPRSVRQDAYCAGSRVGRREQISRRIIRLNWTPILSDETPKDAELEALDRTAGRQMIGMPFYDEFEVGADNRRDAG